MLSVLSEVHRNTQIYTIGNVQKTTTAKKQTKMAKLKKRHLLPRCM